MGLTGQARTAQTLLQKDLSLRTAVPRPPLAVEAEKGYFSCGNLPISYRNMVNAFTDRDVVALVIAENNWEFKVDPELLAPNFIGTKKALQSPAMTESQKLDAVLRSLNSAEYISILNELAKQVSGYVSMTVCNHDEPFRFTSKDATSRDVDYETPYAEVVWFVYQNNLYRVMVPVVPASDPSECRTVFPINTVPDSIIFGQVPLYGKPKTLPKKSGQDIPVRTFPIYRKISLGLLGDPRYRMMTAYFGLTGSEGYMITPNYDDFWEPKNVPYIWGWLNEIESVSGKAHVEKLLENYLVLPNVIQFQVEVWNPRVWDEKVWNPRKQPEPGYERMYVQKYIILGKDVPGMSDKLPGDPNPIPQRESENGDWPDYYTKNQPKYYLFSRSIYEQGILGRSVERRRQDLFSCYDTWSTQLSDIPNSSTPGEWTTEIYDKDDKNISYDVVGPGNTKDFSIPPPYIAPLPGIRVTIRTFDPDTGQVKMFRVVQDFRTY